MNMPEGLELIDSSESFRIYQYNEPVHDPCCGSPNVEFIIRDNGDVEITTYGAPRVPLEVLQYITERAVGVKGPQCPFDFAHTRHWCGYPGCRDR